MSRRTLYNMVSPLLLNLRRIIQICAKLISDPIRCERVFSYWQNTDKINVIMLTSFDENQDPSIVRACVLRSLPLGDVI